MRLQEARLAPINQIVPTGLHLDFPLSLGPPKTNELKLPSSWVRPVAVLKPLIPDTARPESLFALRALTDLPPSRAKRRRALIKKASHITISVLRQEDIG